MPRYETEPFTLKDRASQRPSLSLVLNATFSFTDDYCEELYFEAVQFTLDGHVDLEMAIKFGLDNIEMCKISAPGDHNYNDGYWIVKNYFLIIG